METRTARGIGEPHRTVLLSRRKMAGTARRAALWLAWLLACCLIPALQARAQDIQREVFVDPGGRMDIATVTTQTFQPGGPIQALGYTPAALWVRVTVPPGDKSPLVATVRPGFLDDIRVYTRLPGHPGSWQESRAGDRLPYCDRERHELTPAFDLPVTSGGATVFYVRVQTTSTMLVSIRVDDPQANDSFEHLHYLIAGVYCTLLLLVAVMSLFRFWSTRDWAWLLLGVFQFGGMAFALSWNGFLAMYVWPDGVEADRAQSWLACLHLLLGVLVFAAINRVLHGPRVIFLLRLLVVPLFLWQGWLLLHGSTLEALSINANATLVVTLLGLIEGLRYRHPDRWLRYTGLFINTTLVGYLAYFILPIIGLGTVGELHLYSAIPSNLFAALMLSVVLARRDSLKMRALEARSAHLHDLQQHLKWEQERNEESASFLAMLTHELKTPLSVIRMTLGLEQPSPRIRDSAQQAVDDINAVVERCVYSDKIGQQLLERRLIEFDLLGLLEQQIAALRNRSVEFGHDGLQAAPMVADPAWVKVISTNLIDNALKYGLAERPVHVRLRAAPRQGAPGWLLDVVNAVGPSGRPDPAQLYSKYYRAPGAHSHTGTGLGLFIVRSLCIGMHGELTYHAEDTGHVHFSVWLPAEQRHD